MIVRREGLGIRCLECFEKPNYEANDGCEHTWDVGEYLSNNGLLDITGGETPNPLNPEESMYYMNIFVSDCVPEGTEFVVTKYGVVMQSPTQNQG